MHTSSTLWTGAQKAVECCFGGKKAAHGSSVCDRLCLFDFCVILFASFLVLVVIVAM